MFETDILLVRMPSLRTINVEQLENVFVYRILETDDTLEAIYC